MSSPPDIFREVLKEFKAADTLLSNQVKSAEDEASRLASQLTNRSETTEQVAEAYWQRIRGNDTSRADLGETGNDLAELKELAADIQNHEQLAQKQREEKILLERQRREALLKEQADRRRRIIRRIGISVAAVCVVIGVHFWLLSRTTLSLSVSINVPKPLLQPPMASVTVDGRSFQSGDRITLGRHRIAVSAEGFEPLERIVWIFYGRKDLGMLLLDPSKGSLSVTVKPPPATVIVQQSGTIVLKIDAPLSKERLPVGDYSLVIQKGKYEETHPIKIKREKSTILDFDLNLGGAQLSSEPPDAEFELVLTNPAVTQFELLGSGGRWRGKLPAYIDDLPIGNYQFLARRNGWELAKDVLVTRASVTTNKIQFTYGSLEVTSIPTGIIVSTNGEQIGKTPIHLGELKPGQYELTATDGENDLTAQVNVGPNDIAKHIFDFHYGTVRLLSSPPGATVIRKGKECGKTPLTLDRIHAEPTTVELRLHGYVSTNLAILAREGLTTSYSVKLSNERYLAAMRQAEQYLDAEEFDQALKSVEAAIQADPTDPKATALRIIISQQIDLPDSITANKNPETRANGKADDLSGEWAGIIRDPSVYRNGVGTRSEECRLVIEPGMKAGKYFHLGRVDSVQIVKQGNVLSVSTLDDKLKFEIIIAADEKSAEVHTTTLLPGAQFDGKGFLHRSRIR